MNKKIVFILCTIVMILCSALAYAENVMYVQSMKAKVMSQPSFKAKIIGEAGKGTQMTALGRSGNWVKVKYASTEGYVAALLLSAQPPLQKLGLIKADEGEISHGVRRRASTYTSAAAARGLVQDDRRRVSRDEKSDMGAVLKLEAITIRENEVLKFMEGGKI
jgi:hypothetical protein